MKCCLFILLLLAACGVRKPLPEIELNEFASYYNSFIADSAKYGRTLNIQYFKVEFVSSLPGNILGQCTAYSAGNGWVDIDSDDWYSLSEVSKKVLLYHEMGHCLLGRVHRNEFVNGHESSIMNWYLLNDQTYLDNKEYYLQELFTWK